jgi:hypothetical protein
LNFQTLPFDGCFARKTRPAGPLFSFDFFSLPPLFSLIPPELSSPPSLYLFNFPPFFLSSRQTSHPLPLFIYLIFFFSATRGFFFSAFFFFSSLFYLPRFFSSQPYTHLFFFSAFFFFYVFFSPAFFLLSHTQLFFFSASFSSFFFFFSSTLKLPHCCRRYPLSPEIQTRDPTPPELQAR